MINIIIGILQLLGSLAICFFWYSFSKEDHSTDSEAYLSHEKSFPIVDLGWVVPTLIIAAIGNFLGDKIGIYFTAVSGGALVFLGLIDLTYNIQQGRHKSNVADLILNLVVLIGGIVAIIYGWLNF